MLDNPCRIPWCVSISSARLSTDCGSNRNQRPRRTPICGPSRMPTTSHWKPWGDTVSKGKSREASDYGKPRETMAVRGRPLEVRGETPPKATGRQQKPRGTLWEPTRDTTSDPTGWHGRQCGILEEAMGGHVGNVRGRGFCFSPFSLAALTLYSKSSLVNNTR